MRHCLSIVFVFLLVLSLPAMAVGPAAGASDGASSAPGDEQSTAAFATSDPSVHALSVVNERELARPSAATTRETIDESVELHQRPDEPGEFGAVATISIPEAVTRLELSVPSEAAVEATDGFTKIDSNTLEWDGETADPTVTLGVEANRQYREGGHRSTATAQRGEDLDFAETGEWGIVAVPQLSYGWQYRRGHSVAVERTASVDGEGAVGETIAVFGPVEEFVSEANGERHRLVVPEAADLAESPDAILGALNGAGQELDVGARNDEFFVVAAPVGEVDWRASGLQYGDSDAWVRADADLERPGNVWLHEYTHSRQPFAGVGNGTTAATRWLVEGQADYYAATLALELGYVEYDAFRRFVERGSRYPYDQGVLADPGTWADRETPYARGPLALLAMDREIRHATDGDRSLQGVFRRVGAAERPLELAEFYAAVEDVGGPDAVATAERVVEIETIPDTRSESAYRSLFAVEPTAFDTAFAEEAIAVTGPYRDGSIDEPGELVPGETAAIPITVTNVDATAGHYDAALAVDGEIVDATAGQLDAGVRTTETVAWTPSEPGTYELQVGDDRRTVTVEAAATATVTDLAVSDRSVDVGDDVTATAVVTGHPDRPSTREVTIRTPGGTVATETVHLAPGESTQVEATFTLHENGLNQVSAGDRQTLVGVGRIAGYAAEAEAALTSLSTTAIAGVTALVAALGSVLVARRRGILGDG
ncbi:putative protease with the C-terminal PDZ domain [Halovivax ruber XH-70]|uniref:Putative protease with the C-terminal PDZ domain n=1 Tax=Halovivax ruber (strain DSM 18193 / JCM 13892 / XH-70) TaxID=797302 RepID=L0IDU1_HALRX|nr:CARDB domain-containing protein [Halovivax ruber]AGB17725.1 putative protease with the C-terminal PDZ domain [Halovivax ruber XH-70]